MIHVPKISFITGLVVLPNRAVFKVKHDPELNNLLDKAPFLRKKAFIDASDHGVIKVGIYADRVNLFFSLELSLFLIDLLIYSFFCNISFSILPIVSIVIFSVFSLYFAISNGLILFFCFIRLSKVFLTSLASDILCNFLYLPIFFVNSCFFVFCALTEFFNSVALLFKFFIFSLAPYKKS